VLRVKWWQDRLYPRPERRNLVRQFLPLLADQVRQGDRVLDLGGGAGEKNVYNLRGKCAEIVGVDLDPRIKTNPLVDRGIVADVSAIPIANDYFDVVFAIAVLEHVGHPQKPNFLHYVALTASLTPTWFHKWYNSLRGVEEDDVFPTFYRLNTRRALVKAFAGVGFELGWVRRLEAQPNYLSLTLPTFLIGALYERIVNSTDLLSPFRSTIFCRFVKPEALGQQDHLTENNGCSVDAHEH
jgi:hypothetical protein